MKSWKTTLCGVLVAGCSIAAKFLPQYSEIFISAEALITSLGLVLSKDGNITGGAIDNGMQTPNEKKNS